MKNNIIGALLTIILLFSIIGATCSTIAFAEVPSHRIENDPSGNDADTLIDAHFKIVSDIFSEPMQIVIGENSNKTKTVLGSKYIPLVRGCFVNILCELVLSEYDTEEYYIYFYDKEKNIAWNVFDYIDKNTKERNRISAKELRELNGFQFSDILNAEYIRVASVNGHGCKVLIWDGIHTGYPITTLSSVFTNDGNIEQMPADASFSIQIPDTAQYLIAKPGYTFIGMTVINGTTWMNTSNSTLRFPAQVVDLSGIDINSHKNIRIIKNYNYNNHSFSNEMPNGDISDYIVSIDILKYREDTGFSPISQNLADRIEACMNFVWEAKENVGSFKKGITYYGIPYRSSWATSSSVGWHVTKQTFMNAANDPDSIFYHTPSEEKPGPYYSLVCSSFATLVKGMLYPNTVLGLMNDINNTIDEVPFPIAGALMTNGIGHCYIPINSYSSLSEDNVLTVAEQITPITSVRNIFESIPDTWKGIGPKASSISKYVYSVTSLDKGEVPYDIVNCVIKNGSARPFRGDQCVFTSSMDVLINIKNLKANRLYYQKFEVECDHGYIESFEPQGEASYIDIIPGVKQINLRSATKENGQYSGVSLKNGGVYGVWASVNDEQCDAPCNVEFFEWYDLDIEKIYYSVFEHALFTHDLFWYAMTKVYQGDSSKTKPEFGGSVIPCISLQDSIPDYTMFSKELKLSSNNSVMAFFRKGRFGAYVTSKEFAPWIVEALS